MRLKAAILAARDRAFDPDPKNVGLKAPIEELDPFLKGQLQLLIELIDASRDEATGEAKKVGPLEHLFNAWNDPNLDAAHRIRAATGALTFFHKRVPTTLQIEDERPDGVGDESTLAQVSALLSRLSGKKHAPDSPSVVKAKAKKEVK